MAIALAHGVEIGDISDMEEHPNTPEKRSFPATERSIPIAMLRAREALMAPIRHILSEAGVTEQQWRVLRVLQERGTMDPKDLAQAACLLNPSLTRIMQLLESKGLIARRGHPTDRRRMLVDVTSEGEALIARVAPQSREVFDRLEALWGRERMDALLDLLNGLSELDLEV